MQVGVEVAEDIDLVEHVPVEVPDDPVEIVAGGLQGIEVGLVPLPLRDHDLDQRDAFDELGGQDPRGRVIAVDAGDPLVLVAFRVCVEQRGLTCLDEVVELVGGPPREFVDHLATARDPEQVGPVEHPGHRIHQVDVRLEDLANVRPLDLDRDRLAAEQDRPMDLADRRGRERGWRERSEDRLGLASQLLPDDRPNLGIRERRDVVEELEQLVAVGRWEQVEAEREHLAQLDPGAAQLFEREARPDRAAPGVGPGQVQGRGDEEPDEDGEDAPNPPGVSKECSHALMRGLRVAGRGPV